MNNELNFKVRENAVKFFETERLEKCPNCDEWLPERSFEESSEHRGLFLCPECVD